MDKIEVWRLYAAAALTGILANKVTTDVEINDENMQRSMADRAAELADKMMANEENRTYT